MIVGQRLVVMVLAALMAANPALCGCFLSAPGHSMHAAADVMEDASGHAGHHNDHADHETEQTGHDGDDAPVHQACSHCDQAQSPSDSFTLALAAATDTLDIAAPSHANDTPRPSFIAAVAPHDRSPPGVRATPLTRHDIIRI